MNAIATAPEPVDDDTWVPGEGTPRVVGGPDPEPETPPAPAPASDSSRRDETRPYVVLEECDLAALVLDLAGDLPDEALHAIRDVQVHRALGEFEARNAEHALRQAAKNAIGPEGGEADLIPVSARMWRRTHVTVRATHTVSVG